MVEALRHALRMTFLSWGATINTPLAGLSVDVAPQDRVDEAIWQELSHDRSIIKR
jgi:hypothetical protein